MHWRTTRALKRGLFTAAVVLGLALLCLIAVKGALTPTDASDNVAIERIALTMDADGAPAITGALRNNTDQTYDHVQIDIQLLNANGDSVDHLTPATTKLAPGATWTFQAPIERTDVVRFRVTSLACLADGSTDNRCALGRHVEVQ